MSLKDKVVIITGGSGGIGRAIIKRFLQEGAFIVNADLCNLEEDEAIQNLKTGGELFTISTDISKENEMEKLINETLRRYGTLDILVNGAGIQSPIGLFMEIGLQDWINNININLIGTVISCKAILPIMTEKKRGKIINFSGGGANNSRPNFSAYAASKAAIVRLTEILADELKPFNIQANAVSPGVINTKMIDEILNVGPEKAGREYEQVKSRTREGFDSPDLVAQLVCYLASDESNWITGRVISAVWDPWKEWKANRQIEIDKDMYVLRRIDGRNYIKANK